MMRSYRARPARNPFRPAPTSLLANRAPSLQLTCAQAGHTTIARSIFLPSINHHHPPSSALGASSHRLASSYNPWKMNTDIEYRDLKPITDMPSDDILLIDVREEAEVIQGNIPSSVNMPMSTFEKLIELHPDDFIKTVGFPKPKPEQKIIFYCRSGARSAKALEIAKLKGFKNVRNYKGSWLDWMDKENAS
ncbi:hypothetical protein PtB15_12B269 [Puccinia triticina]|nr:hypothetical protein PtB15_12B269 [Puccinia triticina]